MQNESDCWWIFGIFRAGREAQNAERVLVRLFSGFSVQFGESKSRFTRVGGRNFSKSTEVLTWAASPVLRHIRSPFKAPSHSASECVSRRTMILHVRQRTNAALRSQPKTDRSCVAPTAHPTALSAN